MSRGTTQPPIGRVRKRSIMPPVMSSATFTAVSAAPYPPDMSSTAGTTKSM
ncbi:hypothetical protein Q9G87_29435 [Nonomuraea sp. G32]|nr:hypothetical protein [Nonomuraea sp. G32]MDP4506125.1 hypothetical protein [Nonomuraea sp. G32]